MKSIRTVLYSIVQLYQAVLKYLGLKLSFFFLFVLIVMEMGMDDEFFYYG